MTDILAQYDLMRECIKDKKYAEIAYVDPLDFLAGVRVFRKSRENWSNLVEAANRFHMGKNEE